MVKKVEKSSAKGGSKTNTPPSRQERALVRAVVEGQKQLYTDRARDLVGSTENILGQVIWVLSLTLYQCIRPIGPDGKFFVEDW